MRSFFSLRSGRNKMKKKLRGCARRRGRGGKVSRCPPSTKKKPLRALVTAPPHGSSRFHFDQAEGGGESYRLTWYQDDYPPSRSS